MIGLCDAFRPPPKTIKPAKCCPPNEKLYDSIFPCKYNTCTTALHGPIFNCFFLAPKAEFKYCDCLPDYYRNTRNVCVSYNDCKAIDAGNAPANRFVTPDCSRIVTTYPEKCLDYCCPKNERIYTEKRPCAENDCTKKCENLQALCDQPQIPEKANHPYCDCDEGFYRQNGICVSGDQCVCTTTTQ